MSNIACRHCGSASRLNPCLWPRDGSGSDCPGSCDAYIDDADRRERRVWGHIVRAAIATAAFVMLCMVLAACNSQTTGGRGGAFCDVETPTRLSAPVIAKMNHKELAAAAARNRFGERQCGWRP